MKDIFLLDVDETLLDFRRGEREQLTRVLTEAGLKVGDEVVSRFHEINDGLWKRLERGEITREKLVIERFEQLFRAFGFVADAKEISRAYVCGMQQAGYPLEGAIPFLQELSGHGEIYFVTNGSRDIQRARLKMSGIAPFAKGVFISQEVGADKPSPRYYEYVEAHIKNYARERAVWVGDSLSSDIACARSANIDCILYAPGGAPQGYEGLCAKSYNEILKLILSM